jgi:hypothetical protein
MPTVPVFRALADYASSWYMQYFGKKLDTLAASVNRWFQTRVRWLQADKSERILHIDSLMGRWQHLRIAIPLWGSTA